MELRICGDTLGRGCLEAKPLEAFAKKGKHRDGSQRYHPLCKPCFASVYAEWCRANPTKRAATRLRSYERNTEALRKKARERANARKREVNRVWHEANREENNARRRAAYRERVERSRDEALR